MGIDDHVSEMLNEFTRLERRLAACELRNASFRRRLRDLEKSRDRWKAEVANLKFQLSQRNSK